MEFTKKQLRTSCEQGRASIQMTVENDYNLPDYKPDMVKLIDKKGRVVVGEVRTEQDQAAISGTLQFQVLYKCSEEGGICSLGGEIPFSETLHMEGITQVDEIVVRADIGDLSIGMINSRKLNVRALLEMTAVGMSEQQVDFPVGVEEDAVLTRYESKKLLQLVVQKKDVCRIRDEILLPSNRPNIREILWQNVQLRGLDSRMREGGIELTGELFINILYRGEDDQKLLQCMETTVALHETIRCDACEPEMFFQLILLSTQFTLSAQEDEDGEMRLLLLEGAVEFYVRVWNEEELRILEDVYSLSQTLKLARQPAGMQGLLVKNNSRFKVADQLPMEKQADILQLCAAVGEAVIEDSRIVSGGIEVEGVLKVRILYITASDELPIGVTEGVIPFTKQLEADGIRQEDNYGLTAFVDQLTVILADNSRADIKAVIGLDAIVFRMKDTEVISSVESVPEDALAREQQPGIVGYIVRANDRLWDIAKENHTTVQAIMQMNGLATEQVNRGDKLLIMRV